MSGPAAPHDYVGTSAPSFVAILQKLVAAGSVLAACGYMSFRAHLNFLGISSLSSLGVERYLMETYTFAVALVLRCLVLGLGVAIAAAPLILAFVGLRSFTPPSVRRALHDRAHRLIRAYVSSGAVVYMLVAVVGAHMLFGLLGGRSDCAIGLLSAERLQRQTWRFDVGFLGVAVAAAMLILGRAAAHKTSAIGESSAAHLWSWAGYALVPSLIALPMLFGQAARPALYPTALVEFLPSTKRGPECGLLVLASGRGLTLWQQREGYGRVTDFALDQVAALSTGPLVDLLSTAQEVARGAGVAEVPSCASLAAPALLVQ